MKNLSLIFLLLTGFNIFVWGDILINLSNKDLSIYFLDVGQGDASLVKLPGDVDILIDGGPGKDVLSALKKAMPISDRYIDIVLLSHADLDHFGGLIEVIRRYKVGIFIYNGHPGNVSAWNEFANTVKKKGIPIAILDEGDSIIYENNIIEILAPSTAFSTDKSRLNDASLVAKLISKDIKALFTGDIGFDVEDYLVLNHDMDIDILKVAHHGSKYSSSNSFLEEASPIVSFVSSGKNSYGHPTKAVLSRLSFLGSEVYRTDKHGSMRVNISNGILSVYSLE